MKKYNIPGLACTIIVALSVFLPFLSDKSTNVVKSLMPGDGVIIITACIVALLGVITRKNALLMMGGIVNLLIIIIDGVINIGNLTKGKETHIFERQVGFYVILIGSILMIASMFINRRDK